MHKIKILIVTSIALSAFAIPVFAKAPQQPSTSVMAQVRGLPICKNPNGRTRERINPTETKRNAQGCVVAPYPSQCATKNCYNCEDFQYQSDAQAFLTRSLSGDIPVLAPSSDSPGDIRGLTE